MELINALLTGLIFGSLAAAISIIILFAVVDFSMRKDVESIVDRIRGKIMGTNGQLLKISRLDDMQQDIVDELRAAKILVPVTLKVLTKMETLVASLRACRTRVVAARASTSTSTST
jgi:hypothetical protein